jgi:hypothetical protein
MIVRGGNFHLRKARLVVEYCVTGSRRDAARDRGDYHTANKLDARRRAVRLAWQRLDDHLYPKGGAR